MEAWKSMLKQDPTEWLLGEDNPEVRYAALKNLLDMPETENTLARARELAMRQGAIPMILREIQSEAYGDIRANFYRDKYRGLVWQLIILAELGADGTDSAVKDACAYILEHSFEREKGGFSTDANLTIGGGRKSGVVPCLTGNMVWSLIRLGYIEDERVQRGIQWICDYQRFDDGEGEVPTGWPYERYEMCWGLHTCHMGVVKALKALSAIPAKNRTEAVQRTIDQGVEYMLKHHIFKRSHDLSQVAKPGWLKFGFPLMYQTDILEILDILSELKIKDSRMDEAMEVVLSKQDDSGRWRMENTYNDKLLVPIEQKGPSKWVTYRALHTIKRLSAL